MKLDSLTGKVINEGQDRAVVGDAMNKYGQELQQNQQMLSQTMLGQYSCGVVHPGQTA